MTYSITAYDAATGRWGLAVQSCVFAVGTRVPSVRRGAGAAAVQAGSPSWYRRPAAEMLARRSPAGAVVASLAALPHADIGQFAVVDADGTAAAHTGQACTVAAGHAVGEGVVTAANLVERHGMWDDMLSAYASASGSFESRLVTALAAGEATGGDVRGRQSAAILVCEGALDGEPVFETDIRVDDSADPVGELTRQVAVKAAWDAMRAALPAGASGDWAAAAERMSAVAPTAPHDALVTFWTGIALAIAGRPEDAAPHLSAAVRANPRWPEYVARDPLLAGHDQRDRVIALMRESAGVAPDGPAPC